MTIETLIRKFLASHWSFKRTHGEGHLLCVYRSGFGPEVFIDREGLEIVNAVGKRRFIRYSEIAVVVFPEIEDIRTYKQAVLAGMSQPDLRRVEIRLVNDEQVVLEIDGGNSTGRDSISFAEFLRRMIELVSQK